VTTSIVECPHCHYKFNYEFIPGVSFYSLRLGTQRLFRCPHCKELHRFSITHFGTDSSLPTYGDNAETGIGGRTWALMLGPMIALIIVGFLLRFLVGFQHPLFLLIPITLGILWIVVYFVYLIMKSGRYTEYKADEAK
jgi:hypothetical protein